MNVAALLALLGDLYAQVLEEKARADAAEAKLAERQR